MHVSVGVEGRKRPNIRHIPESTSPSDWASNSSLGELQQAPLIRQQVRKKGHEIERSGKDGKGATVYRMAKGA